MNTKRAFILAVALGLLGLVFAPSMCAEDTLAWRLKEDRVDARIDSWNLAQLLEHLTTVTGWQVFVEPDTQLKVSTKFSNLPSGEALRLLLGNLNFALLPQPGAPARLYVYRHNVHDATQLVRGRDARAVPDELILTLKKGSTDRAEELARRLGAKITGRLGDASAYRLKFADADAARAAREALNGEPDVVVEDNYVVPRPTGPEPLALSSAPPLALNPPVSKDGGSVVVGLIDTAVQRLGNSLDAYVLPGLSVAGGGQAAVVGDAPTHGTAMMETVLRGLSSVPGGNGAAMRILPVDVYGQGETSTMFDVASGISLAIQNGATVINLSLAGSGGASYLDVLIQNTSRNGVLYFAAAGNQPTTVPSYPAAYPSVLAVTAGSSQGVLAPYANRGSFVDLVLPGTSIVQYGHQNWLVNGTSAATAYASGLAAATAAATGRALPEVAQNMRQTLGYTAGGK